MVAKHDNPLINKLSEKLKERKVSKAQFALDTGIPKDRIYKWFQEGNNPKAEDIAKINAWINMEKIPHSDIRDGIIVEFSADREKLLRELQKDIIRLTARVDILSITLADIVSKVDKKAIATVDSELIEAANRRSEALLNELKKRFS